MASLSLGLVLPAINEAEAGYLGVVAADIDIPPYAEPIQSRRQRHWTTNFESFKSIIL